MHLLRRRRRVHRHARVPVDDGEEHGHELGSVGHGDAHAGSRLGHSPRLELIVHLVDEVLQLRVRQRRAVVHRRDGRFGRVRDEVADGPVPRQALGEPIAGEEPLLDAKVGSLDEEVREGRDGLDGDVRLVVRARERGRGPRVLELDLPAMRRGGVAPSTVGVVRARALLAAGATAAAPAVASSRRERRRGQVAADQRGRQVARLGGRVAHVERHIRGCSGRPGRRVARQRPAAPREVRVPGSPILRQSEPPLEEILLRHRPTLSQCARSRLGPRPFVKSPSAETRTARWEEPSRDELTSSTRDWSAVRCGSVASASLAPAMERRARGSTCRSRVPPASGGAFAMDSEAQIPRLLERKSASSHRTAGDSRVEKGC